MNSGEIAPPGAPSSLPRPVCERRSAVDHIALACAELGVMRERLEVHNVEYRLTEVPTTGEIQLFLREACGVGIELIVPHNQFPVRPHRRSCHMCDRSGSRRAK